jgi:hypothetical protein
MLIAVLAVGPLRARHMPIPRHIQLLVARSLALLLIQTSRSEQFLFNDTAIDF